MSASPRRWLVLAILTIATVALSHDLLYVLAHGAGEAHGHAMDASGHASYWDAFVLTATVLAGGLIGITAWQIRRLAGRIRLHDSRRTRVPDAPIAQLRSLGWTWWRQLFVASTAWFFLQENLERIAHGDAAPLLGVLLGEHWLAVPILALVALAIAAVAALVAWRRGALLARLAAPRPWARRTAPAFAIPRDVRPRRTALSVGHALRAPPSGSALI